MSSQSRGSSRVPILALVSAAALLFASALPVEAVKYVDKNNAVCSDLGPGTQAEPFCTIQRGYDQAADGEQVRVLPGTYEECVRAFDLAATKNVELVADAWLQVPRDNTVTIVEAPPACIVSPVNVSGRGPTGSKFEGFTVRNGVAGGIFGAGSVVITNNVVVNNITDYAGLSSVYAGFGLDGGGIYVYSANCFLGDTVATVANNDVRNNRAGQGGGGIAVSAGVRSVFFGFPDCDFEGDAVITVEGNTVTANSTETGFGGGIDATALTNDARTVSVVITRNTIEGNVAGEYVGSTGYGGGIYIWSLGTGRETLEISNNVIRGNHGDHTGGISAGIFPWVARPSIDQRLIIEDNTITGNTSNRGGGGIDLFLRGIELNEAQRIEMSVRRNVITGNRVIQDQALSEAELPFHGGGGISAVFESIASSSPDVVIALENNRICNNSSKMFGGGVSLQALADQDSTAQIHLLGNLICQNDVSSDIVGSTGGGVFAYLEAEGHASARIDMDLNTIAGNTLDNVVEAGGIHAESFTSSDGLGHEGLAALSVTNSIVASNDGVGVGGPFPGTSGVLTPGGTGNLSSASHYSDLFGNDFDHASWVVLGTGNNSIDPLFVDPAAGDFHLAPGSPAIDAGDPAVASGGTATDADGDPRVADGDGDGTAVVDMGYDESVGGAIAVAIDIKPGDLPNVVNLRSRGVIPVAILGSAGFDVTTLDVTTLRFGPGEAAPFHDLLDPATYEDHLQDVNLDGYLDLMTHYETRAAGIDCEAAEAALIGRTLSGEAVRGTDSIECRYSVRPTERDERIRELREGATVEIAPR